LSEKAWRIEKKGVPLHVEMARVRTRAIEKMKNTNFKPQT
jgi:hypothetical protein